MVYFRQFRIPDMGCASYMVGSQGECAVIDPQWDIEPYLRIARKEGFKITHIIDTHVHADHISGNRRLAQQTGATIHLHRAAQAAFDCSLLEDGDVIEIGQARLTVIHTPGHTPESIVLEVTDLAEPEAAPYLLSGDTLFVGDVGRPDLAGKEGASQLYHSLHDRVFNLPPEALVYPAHLAGSLCGRNLSTAHSSVLGTELRTSPALQLADENTFVHYLMDEVPPHPADFKRIIGINRAGPPLETAPLVQLSPDQANNLITEQDAHLIDLREPESYWNLHLAPSLNVPVYSNQFGPNVVNFISPSNPLILVAEDETDAAEAVRLLAGVGRTNILGFLESATALVETSNFKPVGSSQVTLDELQDHPAPVIVDVREPGEWKAGTIPGSVNIPLRQVNRPESLTKLKTLLQPGGYLLTVCDNANRSSVAASYLEEQGLTTRNLAEGYPAWKEKQQKLEKVTG